ncbi:hypothetical protein GCM10015536_34800 [Streptomyces griseomycini]|nr:hypothetical protein GCM10015536_34800 [Streptomyces griseomycini]
MPVLRVQRLAGQGLQLPDLRGIAGDLSPGISSGHRGEAARYARVLARISSPMSIHISMTFSALRDDD